MRSLSMVSGEWPVAVVPVCVFVPDFEDEDDDEDE